MDTIQDLKRDIIRKRDHLEIKDETLDAVFALPDNTYPSKTSLKASLEEMQVEDPQKYVGLVYLGHSKEEKQKAIAPELTAEETQKFSASKSQLQALQNYMGQVSPASCLTPSEQRAALRTLDTLQQEMPKLSKELERAGKDLKKSVVKKKVMVRHPRKRDSGKDLSR